MRHGSERMAINPNSNAANSAQSLGAISNAIGLHFHDLRRECGSRLIEAGVNLAAVRDWLGHRDVSTTDRYLATDGVRLQEAARRLEAAASVLTTALSSEGASSIERTH